MKSTGPTTAASGGTSQAYRPTTQSGRPVSGVVRPGSQAGQGGMDTALRTPRTAKTARPVSAASGRHVRVGTGEFYPEFNRYERKVDVVINGLITGKFACYVKQKQTTEQTPKMAKISTS